MEPIMVVVLALAIAVCAYMAWNIGANDVANAMGTSVGSRALTLKQAVIIAAVFEFCGAFFAGDAVTDTVRKGILNINLADENLVTTAFTNDLMFGFIAAMMAAAVWLTIATRFGLPVSTTHSIIGGIVGVGLVLEVQHNASLIDWEVVRKVVMSWVASPLMGGILAFFTFFIVRSTILEAKDPIARSRWLAPILALPTFFTLGLALQFKALKGFISRADSNGWIADKNDWLPYKESDGVFNPMADNAWFPINSLMVSFTIGCIASLILWSVLRNYDFKKQREGFQGVEKIFVWLQIITAAYVAFAHGANDRSNAIGPMAAVYDILANDGILADQVDVPLWLVLLGSAGIAVGVVTWGWRVMETIGTKITDITPTRGFAAEFGAATTILIFSMPFLAVPVSTTHTLVGSVVGVGLAGGAKNVDFRVFGKIAASWVASLPAAGFGAITLYVAMGSDPLKLIVVLPISFLLVGYVMWKTNGDEIFVEDALADAGGDKSKYDPTVFELFHTHAEAVENTVNHMLSAVKKATDGEDASEEIKATIEAELKADDIKNALREKVSSKGWKLLIDSDEFLYMLGRQDRIADYAQNVAEQLSFRELYENKEARLMVVEMAEAVQKTAAIYEDTVLHLRNLTLSGYTKKGRTELGDLIYQVNLAEHEADIVESRAAGFVFREGSDDPLAAVHMYRVLQRLDDVANACEDAANAFLPIVYN
jgi:PiT family inorganic phosphate transporter|tara:strand:+ start:15613 stop:17745 length:2133 start_codon:yes stop_codon:yes gene_type:complete